MLDEAERVRSFFSSLLDVMALSHIVVVCDDFATKRAGSIAADPCPQFHTAMRGAALGLGVRDLARRPSRMSRVNRGAWKVDSFPVVLEVPTQTVDCPHRVVRVDC